MICTIYLLLISYLILTWSLYFFMPNSGKLQYPNMCSEFPLIKQVVQVGKRLSDLGDWNFRLGEHPPNNGPKQSTSHGDWQTLREGELLGFLLHALIVCRGVHVPVIDFPPYRLLMPAYADHACPELQRSHRAWFPSGQRLSGSRAPIRNICLSQDLIHEICGCYCWPRWLRSESYVQYVCRLWLWISWDFGSTQGHKEPELQVFVSWSQVAWWGSLEGRHCFVNRKHHTFWAIFGAFSLSWVLQLVAAI